MPVTQFAVPEKYRYMNGFGHYHQSEAIDGANPIGHNNPQKPPYGLVTERISGSSFTAPRAQNLQTFLYRVTPAFYQGKFKPYTDNRLFEYKAGHLNISPDTLRWNAFPIEPDGDWIAGQRLLAQAGDPAAKTGLAYRIFAVLKDMEPQTVFFSADGDYLIILQAGALDIETELGNLLVRQNEIAVIPRGVRYRVSLPRGPARGYICELYQGHLQLPELGPIGSTGLANARDFQVPVARFDGEILDGKATCKPNGKPWKVVAKMINRHFECELQSTPFDIAAWHGTYYPYKYDLGRFSVLGSLLFDHPDPSLFVVLTAPSYREPGSAILDFAIIPPRWQVAENTHWLPYYHRNTASEFSGSIVSNQDHQHPLNQGATFKPWVAMLTNAMVPHGVDKQMHEIASEQDTSPRKVDNDGAYIFLLESESIMNVSEWGIRSLGHQLAKAAKI